MNSIVSQQWTDYYMHVHNEHIVFDLKLHVEPQKTCLELGVSWNQLLPGCSQATCILAGGKKIIETPLQKFEAKWFTE